MSSVFGIVVLVALVTCLPPAYGGFWNWRNDWSAEEPSNCPHVNNRTHVCSTLDSTNGTCVTPKCCNDFNEDESNEDYDDESSDHADGMHGGGHHGGSYWGCRLCYSIRTCTLYKCYRSCCEGYERDFWGRCSNKTGNLACENGGVLRHTWRGEQYCQCSHGFRGLNCEIPVCRCKNGGECEIKDGQPYCNCSYGYYGDRCQNSNCTMKCYNGGKCYRYEDKEFCWCPSKFIGTQCEQFYLNPDTCPLPENTDDTCECQCSRNSDCQDGEVCCKEGCSSVCRKHKPNSCTYKEVTFAINATYSPDPCTNCTCTVSGEMECYTVSCAMPNCVYGEPSVIPGNCCPTCPEEPDPPVINNCPTSVLHVNVTSTTNQAVFDEGGTKITAYDANGNKLLVLYRPEKVHHCHCSTTSRPKTTVQAYTTDVHGGTATCSFNVIVKDSSPPRFTYCPTDVVFSQNDMAQWRQPTYEDNVGISRVAVPDKPNNWLFPVGTHVITYQVWDYDNNTATCKFNVVINKVPPRIDHCPEQVLRLNTTYYTDFAELKESITGIQAYDSEDNKLQVIYQPQTVKHCKCSDASNKVYTVKATAADDFGSFVECSFKVVVTDIYPPQFSFCQDNISVSVGEPVVWKEPVYTDNVGVARRHVNIENGDVLPVGKHTVKYDVEDYDGNTATCQFNVAVAEVKPETPKIHNCPQGVVQVNTSYYTDHAFIDDRNTGITAYDAEGNILQVKYTPMSVKHCYCYDWASNANTVYAEAIDSHGNKATCQFKVTVKDIYKPVFSYCPRNIYVTENEIAEWKEPIFYDNVKVVDSSVSGYTSGRVLPVGNYTVHYKAWDYHYNYASCIFNVSVTKETPKPPKIVNCPTQVLYISTGQTTDQAIPTEETTSIKAFDHEGNKLQVNFDPFVVRHCHCQDAHTVETVVNAMVVDEDGVQETCTFNVTVYDKYRPVITNCPQNIEALEGEKVVWKEPTITDNVGVLRWEINRKNGAIFSTGRHTVIYIAWDYDLNNATCQFNVAVTKRSPPIIHNCPNYGLYMFTPATSDSVDLNTTFIQAFDSGGNKLKVIFRPESVRHCYCDNSASIMTSVEATATDHYGNVATCTFRAFVLDQVKPTILHCPGNINVDENEMATWREPDFYDNVKVAKISVTGRKRNTVFPVGSHRVGYEIWDYDGNSATCQFNVTVTKAVCTLKCYNGGECTWNGNVQSCTCTSNFIGKHCEYEYTHPSTCPVPETSSETCDLACTRDTDCYGPGVCCKEGCSTVCRSPRAVYCLHEGKQYRTNETYSPDSCTRCTCTVYGKMVCATSDCEMPRCAGGRQPVSTPGQCCLTCPEEPKPRIICPTQTLHLNTSYYSNMTMLDDQTTFVTAYDSLGKTLQVNFEPPFVHHCNCNNPTNHVTKVDAYALDHLGNVAACSFNVVVRDIYPPKVFSCPEDVFVFEQEIVEWLEPNAVDNVGIAGSSCSSQKNGDVFPVGEHQLSCDIWDYDKNTASCHFRVSVTKKDTPLDGMPVGLRERYVGDEKGKLQIILPPIFGAILLVILALVVFFCRRKCQTKLPKKNAHKPAKAENIYAVPDDVYSVKPSIKSKRPSMSTYSSSGSTKSLTPRAVAFHSNIYAVPGDVGVRPPPYTVHPGYSPPPYSVSGGSIKDVTYLPFQLQAYYNPGYETLSVHSSSVFGESHTSRSTVSSRSSKHGSSRSSRSSKAGSVKSTKSSKLSSRA